MKRSKEATRTARQLLQATQVEGKLDEERARSIVRWMKETKPRGYMEALDAYLHLIRLELAKQHALVESAVALGAELEAQVKKNLTEKYGSDLTFEFRIDPSLLGGTRIKVGSDVWDGSVKGRLEQLANAIG